MKKVYGGYWYNGIMNLPKSVILQFFIKNGAMIIVAVSLFLTMFIPALAILISLFALSFALVVFQTVRYGKNDIVFISIAMALQIIVFISNLIVTLRSIQ